MKLNRIILFLGLFVFILATLTLGWGLWPESMVEHKINFNPAQMIFQPGGKPGIPVSYTMVLNYPPFIRSGDRSRLRIVFQPLEMSDLTENLPPVENVFIETRLEIPGVRIEPAGTAGQILSPGRAITFWWTVEPTLARVYEGTAWMGLRVRSANDSSDQFMALAAPRVEIRTVRLLFLSGPAARWAGSFGLVFSAVLFFWRWRHA